ncbi:MAG: hypothetical protein HYY64_00850 [Candidatus Rokubacteria bacterium]|nr:hypothetical protein [Candidatus Rokubacteria bacterium]
MRRLFILFLVGHVVMDLAIFSAGAFRFNADESVVALRVQPVQAQGFAFLPQVEPLRPAVDLRRPAEKVPTDLQRSLSLPELIPLLPRRDPTADRSPQSPTEPA